MSFILKSCVDTSFLMCASFSAYVRAQEHSLEGTLLATAQSTYRYINVHWEQKGEFAFFNNIIFENFTMLISKKRIYFI